ncbi:MAG: hypothetical protein R3C09_13810 [Pirellulaceae bacterium]
MAVLRLSPAGRRKAPTLDTRLLEAQGHSIPPGGMPAPVAPDPNGHAAILEVREDGTHVESIPLAMDRSVFIEDIVQQARFRQVLIASASSMFDHAPHRSRRSAIEVGHSHRRFGQGD